MPIHKSSFLKVTALLCLIFDCSFAQDSLIIEGIKIAPNDSLKAREVLHTVVPPSSEFWKTQHQKPGNYSASNTFYAIWEIAYPLDPSNINQAYVDSVQSFLIQVYNQHSEEGVRAEFLYKAVRFAHQTGRKDLAAEYYSILTSEFSESYYVSRAKEYAPNRAIQIGNPIPKFKIPKFIDTTQTYSNEDFAGKTYLIDFWGTWCGPCIAEMPFLHKSYQRYKDHGFTILSIAIHDIHNAVQDFRKNEWPMPWHHSFIKNDSALEDKVVSRFEVYGVPKTILVNKQGDIIATEIDLRGKRLLETLEEVF